MISQNCIILYDELLIQQSNLLQKSKSINDEKESKKLSIEINNINSGMVITAPYLTHYDMKTLIIQFIFFIII